MPNHCNAPLFYLNNNKKKKKSSVCFSGDILEVEGCFCLVLVPSASQEHCCFTSCRCNCPGFESKDLADCRLDKMLIYLHIMYSWRTCLDHQRPWKAEVFDHYVEFEQFFCLLCYSFSPGDQVHLWDVFEVVLLSYSALKKKKKERLNTSKFSWIYWDLST